MDVVVSSPGAPGLGMWYASIVFEEEEGEEEDNGIVMHSFTLLATD